MLKFADTLKHRDRKQDNVQCLHGVLQIQAMWFGWLHAIIMPSACHSFVACTVAMY